MPQALILKKDETADFFLVALDGGKTIGRIFKSNSAPREFPWFWTINFFHRKGPGPHQGYGTTREDAMKAFRAAWDSNS